jgi:hypothetical protein
VRGSTFSLDFLEPFDGSSAWPDPFGLDGRRQARDLADRYASTVAELLPERNAELDARAPARERWRWLGRLFG